MISGSQHNRITWNYCKLRRNSGYYALPLRTDLRMASIVRHPKGWRALVCVRGNRTSKIFELKTDAARWAAAKELELAQAVTVAPARRTMRDLCAHWLDLHGDARKYAKRERLRLARYDSDPLMDVRLSVVSGEHVALWRDRMLAQVSAGTVLRDWNFLSAICTVGVREFKWLTKNPFSEPRRPTEPRARDRVISPAEVELLLAQLPARIGAVLEFAIETAMRAGEICGLTWEHVNTAKRTAHLPKTKNGTARDVPLSARAVALMGPPGEGSVFGLRSGSLDAQWRKGRGKAGLSDIHFHDTRHTAITRLAKRVPVLALARIVGHRNINQLLVYYNESAEDLAKLLD